MNDRTSPGSKARIDDRGHFSTVTRNRERKVLEKYSVSLRGTVQIARTSGMRPFLRARACTRWSSIAVPFRAVARQDKPCSVSHITRYDPARSRTALIRRRRGTENARGRAQSTQSLPWRRFRTGRNACPPCPHTPTCFLVPARSMRPAHSCSKPSAARAISRSALLVVRLNTVRRCIVVFPKCHRAYEGMIRHPVPMRQCIPGSSRITPHFQDPP